MTILNSLSNQEKSLHGVENQNNLNALLDACHQNGYITDYQKNFRIGYPLADNSKQFYAPFMIQFSDKTRWIVFTTTSMRTDRIKGQQWDAHNLKELDSTISKAILTYPSVCEDAAKFQKQNQKYCDNYEISAIDKIITFEELQTEIEQEFYKKFNEEYSLDDQTSNLGQLWDKQGKLFENHIATILSSPQYFQFWQQSKTPSSVAEDDYAFFLELVQHFNLDASKIKAIHATANKEVIGYLPSGGSPKTDVIVTAAYHNNTNKTITISCKRSKKDSVSIHQYTADTYADILDSNNETLRKLLNDFQYYGNARDMPEGTAEALTKELSPYLPKLALWAIGGYGAKGTSPSQCAQYLISYQTTSNTISIHSIEEYIELISSHQGAFGTPFHWTYASKQRGKCIQLKAPLI